MCITIMYTTGAGRNKKISEQLELGLQMTVSHCVGDMFWTQVLPKNKCSSLLRYLFRSLRLIFFLFVLVFCCCCACCTVSKRGRSESHQILEKEDGIDHIQSTKRKSKKDPVVSVRRKLKPKTTKTKPYKLWNTW